MVTRRISGRDHKDFKNYKVIEYHPGQNFSAIKNHLNSMDAVLIYSDVFDYYKDILLDRRKYKLYIAGCGFNWTFSHKAFFRMLQRSCGSLEKIILHSKRERDYKLLQGTPLESKIKIINNGICLKDLDDNGLQRSDLLEEKFRNKIILTNIGNFFPGKAQSELLSIVDLLPDSNFMYIQIANSIQFAIGRQLEQEWRNKSKKISKKISIKLMKDISREKTIGMLKNSNLFFTCSQAEISSLCLLEASGAKVPWISLNVGNALDLQNDFCKVIRASKDSRYKAIIDDRVRSEFSKTIQELSISGENISGREQIEADYNLEKVLPQYYELLHA